MKMKLSTLHDRIVSLKLVPRLLLRERPHTKQAHSIFSILVNEGALNVQGTVWFWCSILCISLMTRLATKSSGTARRRYQVAAMESCLYMTPSFLLSPMAARARTQTCLRKWICCCWFMPEVWIEPRRNGEPSWPTVGSPMSESYISYLNIGSLKHANDPLSQVQESVCTLTSLCSGNSTTSPLALGATTH